MGRVKNYIVEAIQPFVTARIASRFDVFVSRVGRERIDAHVVIYRGPSQPVELRFQVLWENIEYA